MILIVSKPEDIHAKAVLDELARCGATAQILDLSRFPTQLQLSLGYGPTAGVDFRLESPSGECLDFSSVKAVWWRRPQHFELPERIADPAHRQFAYSESHAAFAGLWNSLDAFWINPLNNDAAAHHKVFQLTVAQELGFTIPQTLVTNHPAEARQFIAARGAEHTVYKAFSATERDWRETRVLRPEELALLDNVRYAPVIFQEYIPAEVDLRITMVGDQIFPAAIYSQETDYKVDFRMHIHSAKIEPVTLPENIECLLHELMQRLGLVYGAIDMRLTPEGRYVFLEINPAGQWLFVEQETGQPIARALAELLADNS